MAMCLTLLNTFFYAALAGFGLPALRAWTVLFLFTVLFLTNKNINSYRLLLIGICLFLFLWPLSIFGQSFWLSFSAVSIIGFVFWRWPPKNKGFSFYSFLSSMVRVQICLTLMMLPIVAWQFSYVSVVSPLINLIAVPIVTLILVPLCIVAVLLMLVSIDWAKVLFALADKMIGFGLDLLRSFLQFEWASISLQSIPFFVWMTICIMFFLVFIPKLWLNKNILFLLVLPLLSYGFPQQSDEWQVDILDVGQGLAVLITKNNRAIVYDVGAAYPSGFNMADSVLVPILQAKGLDSLDAVFISHGDNDHAGSLPQLTKQIPVKRLYTNKTLCRENFRMIWQGLKVEVLWPDNPDRHNDNNGSCVIKISDQFHSVLLPGDIDKSIEKRLVEKYSTKLDVDILLAPHHGSNTSSSSEFIQAVNPKYVVFSQGFMNRWQFPRPKVVSRYKQHKVGATDKAAKLFSTSNSGQVTFKLQFNSSQPIKSLTFRQDTYPYWYANSRRL
jgi:competence protein ComEC